MMSALFKSLEPATDACWNHLVHASWQSAAVGLLLLAVVALGRRWPAPLRYGLLTVALVKFVLPPFGAVSFGVFSQLGPAIGACAPSETPATIDRRIPTATTPADDGMSRAVAITQSRPGTALSTPSSAEMAAPAAVAVSSQRDARPRTNGENRPTFANTTSKIPSVTISQTAEAERPRPVALQWNGHQLALAGWIAGMCLVMVWLCDQERRLRRVLRGSSPVESARLKCRMQTLAMQVGLRRVPELRQSLSGSVPFSCGLFAPKVVVPAGLINELSPEQLDVVLGHELAHHRRGDLWVNALQIVAFVVFWFHPVCWILNRSMRRVREDCCDDLLLARGLITPEACCETLLAVARGQARSDSLVWSVSMAHPLGARLTRLMDDSQPRRTQLSRGGWSLVLLAGALFWPGLRFASAAANDSAPAKDAHQTDAAAKNVAPPRKEGTDAANATAKPSAGIQDAKGQMKRRVSDEFEYSGQATDVNGKPLEGAQVYVSYPDGNGSKFVPKVKTTSDGGFRIRLHESEFPWKRDTSAWKYARVAITASGYGPAFASAAAFWRKTNLVLQLRKDVVPIRGQIVTAAGKPVAGAAVALRMMQNLDRDDGTPLPRETVLDARASWLYLIEYRPDLATLFPPVTTDAAGRFEIRGVGRERVARLFVSGPAVESRWISVATRRTVPQRSAMGRDDSRRLFVTYTSALSLGDHDWFDEYPWGEAVLRATFVQVVEPSCPIVGIVRDRHSGRPLSGVRVSSQPPPIQRGEWSDARNEAEVSDTTNDRGEFRLTGVPKRANAILAEPPDSLPYFNRSVPCNTAGAGTEPMNLEIRLYRGIAVTGRLLDQNGKPVPGGISYYPLVDNPYVESYADGVSVGRTGERPRPQYPVCSTDANGLFYIPVLPGPGILVAQPGQWGWGRGRYINRSPWTMSYGRLLDVSDPTVVPTFPRPISLIGCDAYKGIDLPADAARADVDLRVNAAHFVEGQVLDADGRPLAGVTAFGTSHDRLPESGKFDARAMVPGKPRLLYFLQESKGLGGYCRVQDGERSPIVVRLDSCGSVRGRLADASGKPMANAHFYVVYAEADGIPRVIFPGGVRVPTAADVARYRWLGQPGPPAVEYRWESTDEKGSFLVKGLIPKLAFRLVAQSPEGREYPMTETSVAPGQTQDLGRLKLPVPQ